MRMRMPCTCHAQRACTRWGCAGHARDEDAHHARGARSALAEALTAGERGVLRIWRADSDKPLYETADTLLGPEGSRGVSNGFVNEGTAPGEEDVARSDRELARLYVEVRASRAPNRARPMPTLHSASPLCCCSADV